MKRRDMITELRGLSPEELRERARSLREEMRKLTIRQATGQLEESHRLGQIRKESARVNTFMRQKQGRFTGLVGEQRV